MDEKDTTESNDRPGDRIIIGRVLQTLIQVTLLAPDIPRLTEIISDPNHPALKKISPDAEPELNNMLSMMRRAQIGALLQLIEVMRKTGEMLMVNSSAKRSEMKTIVDKAMSDLGIDL